jgi:hypothetical protein
MEIKLKLDTKKTAKAAVVIAAAYGLCRGTTSNQLAAVNALALIVIVAIIYGPRLVPRKTV